MSPILGIWASQNYSRYQLPTSFESIATTTVGAGGSSSVSFSSIPSTYTHLQIRGISRSTRTGSNVNNLRLRTNSDTGNNYSWHRLEGTGSTVTSDAATTQSSYQVSGYMPSADYANTNKYKTMRSLHGFDNNSTAGKVLFTSGLWQSTSAITTITLEPDTAVNFAQYSHFALYGIKGE